MNTENRGIKAEHFTNKLLNFPIDGQEYFLIHTEPIGYQAVNSPLAKFKKHSSFAIGTILNEESCVSPEWSARESLIG